MSSVPSNIHEFQKRQIDLIVRTTPYAMVGHLVNTAVIAVALAGSVQPVPLIIWSTYSCCVALLLLFRHVRNRGRLPRTFQRAAKKVATYAFLLALPWSSLGTLYLGSLPEGQELIILALGIGMAASATVLLSAIPRAAFLYMSVILIPTAFKCLVFSQKGYLLLGTLALSYWGCLAALIAKTNRDASERQETELALAERDAHLALAAKAGLVGSYSYDPNSDGVQISEGYAAIHGLPGGSKESTRSAWQSRVLLEDRERINSYRRQAFSERRREYGIEYRIVRAGEIRWIESRGFISYSRDGHPQRVIGVNIDITERKRAEERQRVLVAELKQSNKRLRLALDCAELGTWSLHLNTGRFENDGQDRRIHGHEKEAPPKTLAEMRSQVHPGDLSKLDAAFRELGYAGGSSCRTEYRLAPRTDEERAGRERWVTLEGTVVRCANGRPEQLLGVTRDITARKHAEDALRQREAELGEAQRLAHIGSWYWSAETDVIVASDELHRIFGLDPATDRVPTLHDQRGRWYPDADWKRMKAAVQTTMQTGVRSELDLQAFRNGTPIWVTARGEVVRNSEGEIVGLRGTIQDITERKKSEITLAERNVQLALAGRAALVGSYAYDIKTRMLQFSEGYAAIYDLPQGMSEMTGSQRRALVHPEDLERLDNVRSQAFERRQGEFSLEYRNVLPKRGVRWIESRSSIFYCSDGRPERLVGVNIDITDRKQAEQALTERDTQLALAGQAALVGSYVYDVNKGTMHVSQGYATIHGLPEGTTETTIGAWRARVHPEDLTRAEELREQAFADLRKEDNAEYRIILSTGEVRWIERRGSISYNESGCPERVVGVNIDVTERKRIEQTLAERDAQLALAGKAALVGSYAYQADLERMKISDGYAAMHGLPEGTTETTRSLWRARVHPDDLAQMEALRTRALIDRRCEYNVDYRIVLGDEVRWIEARSFISYDSDGDPQGIIGVNIDVTERKQAETLIKEGKTRLADALTAGQVIAFEWNAVPGLIQRSDNAIDILGRDQDGWVGSRQDDFLRHVHPDDRTSLKTCIRELSRRSPAYAVTFRYIRPDGKTVWLEETARGEFDTTGKLSRIRGLTRDISERKRADERQRTLVAELDHRVKNTLATVSAVISHTRRGRQSVDDFAAALEGRIRSMAATHELLSTRWWQGVSLGEVVRRELEPYATRNNTEVSGPEVVLRAEAGQAMAMVLHELITNAAKYGALSTKKGRVSIRWDRRLNGHPLRLVLEWQEIGGPTVIGPGNPSYGTSTIRDLIPYEFGGTVDLVFAPEGVQCHVELPADWLSDAANAGSGAILGVDAR